MTARKEGRVKKIEINEKKSSGPCPTRGGLEE